MTTVHTINLFWKIFLWSLTLRMYKRRTWWLRLLLHLGVLSICYIWNLLLCEKNSPSSINLCPVHTLLENLKTHPSPVILDLCLRKTRAGKSRDYRDIIIFLMMITKLRFQNVFRPHENEKPAFTTSFVLKSVFEKLRFRNGSAWTEDPTVVIKLRFQMSPA